MSEWHVTPDYIINNWTDEMLDLMIQKHNERKERERRAIEGDSAPQMVSDEVLFAQAHNLGKVKKSGD